MYDADLGRFMAIDPKADKYFSLTPYNYCADNPIIFTDPTGAEIEWDEKMSRKEKRYVKAALREHLGSKTYRSVMRTLRKSDYTYTVTNRTMKPSDFGDFRGSYDMQVEMESEIEGDPPDVYTLPINGEENGGTIGINFEIWDTKWVDKKGFKESMSTTVLEEFVHAAQYDFNVHKDGRVDGSQARGNSEFEAKVLVGKILSESNSSTSLKSVKSFDKIPINYGRNLGSNYSQNQYNNAKQVWLTSPPTVKAYGNLRSNNNLPGLLLFHLNQ
jgi:major membrane immunogen (membrane-anchored lipoprotein)